MRISVSPSSILRIFILIFLVADFISVSAYILHHDRKVTRFSIWYQPGLKGVLCSRQIYICI